MSESRIPQLTGTSIKAAFAWFTALHERGLLFHLDNRPEDLFQIEDGSRTFTNAEAKEVTSIVDALFAKQGDKLYKIAFEVLSRTFHTRTERRALKIMYG